jgi:hypothetical protein
MQTGIVRWLDKARDFFVETSTKMLDQLHLGQRKADSSTNKALNKDYSLFKLPISDPAEAARYIENLDEPSLKKMSEHERAEWVRVIVSDGLGVWKQPGPGTRYRSEAFALAKLYHTYDMGPFTAETRLLSQAFSTSPETHHFIQSHKESWPYMKKDEKLEILLEFLNSQSAYFEFRAPDLQEMQLDISDSAREAEYDPSSHIVRVNLGEGPVSRSLEQAVSAVFHEGLHVRQDKIVRDISQKGLPEHDPMAADLLMLWVNSLPHAQPSSALVGDLYRRSPWEQDAWAASDVFRKGIGLQPLLEQKRHY